MLKLGDKVHVPPGLGGTQNISGFDGVVGYIDGHNHYIFNDCVSGSVVVDPLSMAFKYSWAISKKDIHLLTLLNNNETKMNLIKNFGVLFKGEPEKTFIKAGITDSNDMLTEEGSKVFVAWMLKKNGDDFKKEVVDELVKNDEDKK